MGNSLKFFFFFFEVDHFFKSLLNLLQYCYCFMFSCFFGCKTCGILAPWPGIEPAPPVLEGKVLTTGPPGKSLTKVLFFFLIFFFFLIATLFIYFWLCWVFGSCEGPLRLRQVGATLHRGAGTALHRGARAPHHRGPSRCGAQAPEAQAQ